MRYIDKTGNEPQGLIDWRSRVDAKLTSFESDPEKSGDDLWDIMDADRADMDKPTLKTHLVQEQGYLCCYCGARIFPDHNSHIEHLLPKNAHKQLTYQYDNLLVSCQGGTKSVIHRVIAGETEDSIAERYGVDIDFLVSVYVTLDFLDNAKDNYDLDGLNVGDRVIIFPEKTKAEQHCGHKKGKKEINITPLQTDCHKHFKYDARTGEIRITANNKVTVEILGLNDNALLNRNRRVNLEETIRTFTQIQSIAPASEPARTTYIKGSMKKYCDSLSTKNTEGYFKPWNFVMLSLF